MSSKSSSLSPSSPLTNCAFCLKPIGDQEPRALGYYKSPHLVEGEVHGPYPLHYAYVSTMDCASAWEVARLGRFIRTPTGGIRVREPQETSQSPQPPQMVIADHPDPPDREPIILYPDSIPNEPDADPDLDPDPDPEAQDDTYVPETPEPADHSFTTGAKRSKVMPLYSAIPSMSLRRLAHRATGAPKGAPPLTLEVEGHTFEYQGGSRGYGYGNWKRGLPIEDTFNHVIDHLLNWKYHIENGMIPQDDDLAAAAWGIMFPLMEFEKEYAEQFAIRADRLHAGETIDPKDFPLLYPLDPEK